jgi:hypothetical protein
MPAFGVFGGLKDEDFRIDEFQILDFRFRISGSAWRLDAFWLGARSRSGSDIPLSGDSI